jgi:hypothetical protein
VRKHYRYWQTGRKKDMQAVVDVPTRSTSVVSLMDAQCVAQDYVAAHLDPAFEVVEGTRYYHKPLGREIWQFIIRCAHGPLDAIAVDVRTGTVIPLATDKLRIIQEKAALYAARKRNVLPVNGDGYVLGEYARRQVSSYLDEHISLFYEGADPVLVPGEPPVWQVTISFKQYHLGPFTLGVMDVDARTGEPFPLTSKQIKRIRERTRAIIGHQAPTPAAG